MTVRIITDSTTDVTPAAARQLNLGVVPLKVLFGQEEWNRFNDGGILYQADQQ